MKLLRNIQQKNINYRGVAREILIGGGGYVQFYAVRLIFRLL